MSGLCTTVDHSGPWREVDLQPEWSVNKVEWTILDCELEWTIDWNESLTAVD